MYRIKKVICCVIVLAILGSMPVDVYKRQELVKEMMSQSEVYVFEVDKMIQGFVGLNNEYIEGIFVSEEMQSCGIGKLLLNYIKDKKDRLQLNVYQKNEMCIRDRYSSCVSFFYIPCLIFIL